jgi:hypothetical protein
MTTTPRCQQCAGFGEDREATHTANYQPDGLNRKVGDEVLLCAPCADNPWVYCNVKPIEPQETPKGAQCACGTYLPNAVIEPGIEPACIPCILSLRDAREKRDRRRLTKSTGRTW